MAPRRSIERCVTNWHICSRNFVLVDAGFYRTARNGATLAAISESATKSAVTISPSPRKLIQRVLFIDALVAVEIFRGCGASDARLLASRVAENTMTATSMHGFD
ncbi:MAG TPA: hypothetical protein VGQ95_07880 [Chthoniobacterales bacterium]|nr:hypothetical protein [Chthoniobacterales bacterium]